MHADLLRGVLHPALQPFDARPVVKAIAALVAREPQRQQDEWEWRAIPEDEDHHAHFVFLVVPRSRNLKSMHYELSKHLASLGVTCFDEGSGRMGAGFPPKFNEFQIGDWPGETHYDIGPDALPDLLRRIRPKPFLPAAFLTDRRTCYAQCYQVNDFPELGTRFVVEWRVSRSLANPARFDHWKAQDKKKLAALTVPYESEGIPPADEPDLLEFEDVTRIFNAFLQGKARPRGYHWYHMNHRLLR